MPDHTRSTSRSSSDVRGRLRSACTTSAARGASRQVPFSRPVVVEDGPGAGGNQNAIGEPVLFDAAKGVEHAGGTGIVRLACGEPGSAGYSQRRLIALTHPLPGETLRHGQGPRLDLVAGTA